MVTTFFNQKGGVGKTTTCFLFSDWLTKKKRKTLLIDHDLQGTLTDTFIEDFEVTLWDYFQKTKALSYVDNSIDEYRDILPASIFIFRSSEIDSSNLSVEKLYSDKLTEEYDDLLIDYPPTLRIFSRLGLTVSKIFFLPIEATKRGYDVLKDTLQFISTLLVINKNLSKLIVFQNHSQKKIGVKKIYEDLFKNNLKETWWSNLSLSNSKQIQKRATLELNFFDLYTNKKVISFFEKLEVL